MSRSKPRRVVCDRCRAGDCDACVRIVRLDDGPRFCDCWTTHRPTEAA